MAVRLTGWGLLAYAAALATQILFDQLILIILLLPALLWIGAALHLLPEEKPARPILIRIWLVASIPLAILTQLNAWFAALIVLALILCAGMMAKLALTSHFKNTFALLAVTLLSHSARACSSCRSIDSVHGAWHSSADLSSSHHHHAWDEGTIARIPVRSCPTYYAGTCTTLTVH
jgi:hypothetical protein